MTVLFRLIKPTDSSVLVEIPASRAAASAMSPHFFPPSPRLQAPLSTPMRVAPTILQELEVKTPSTSLSPSLSFHTAGHAAPHPELWRSTRAVSPCSEHPARSSACTPSHHSGPAQALSLLLRLALSIRTSLTLSPWPAPRLLRSVLTALSGPLAHRLSGLQDTRSLTAGAVLSCLHPRIPPPT